MVLPTPVVAVLDPRAWEWLAQIAFAIGMWAQARASRQPPAPVDELMDRLRHPVRWALRHPIVSVRRKLDRRRVH